MNKKFTKLMAAVLMLLTMVGLPTKVWADEVTLTSAQIKAGTGSTSYGDCSATDEGGNTWHAYAIKNQHSNATSAYNFWQIKKYASNTAYYVQVPELGTQITSITMTVSSASQPMTGGGNSATLYFSSSSSTSSTGTGVASGTGAYSVTIDCSSLNLNTGFITASGAVRIWNVTVTYTAGGGSTDPSITISGDEISNNAVSFDWNSATNDVEYTASVAYNNMDTPTSSDAVVGVYTDAACQIVVSGNYFAASFGEDTQTIEYAFNEDNPSVESRTVYMRVETFNAEETDWVPCNVIAVTQAGKPQYTVTYNANGATSGTVPTDSNSPYVINSDVTVLGNTGTLVKTGYTWNGWNTQADGSGTSYAAGAQFTITANTTLYAQWILNKHSYTLNVTGGSNLEEDVEIVVPDQTGWVSGAQIEFGQQVSVSVIPLGGYTYTTTVTYGNNVNVPVENDMFTMPDANVTISVVVEKLDNVTFDFHFDVMGSNGWSSSYESHTVDYQEATVTFASANKNSSTITDIPVTKGQPVSIVMKEGQPDIKGVTFNCRQWGTKAQTITLHYSTDGGDNYTSTEITSNNFTISCATLPSGTNAVKITFSSTSNQVGIESATLNFSTDPVIAVNPTSLTGFAYSEGHGPSESQAFTVSGNYLTSNITLAATNFEMSTDETNWSNSLPLVPNNGTVANTTVYVRLKSGLAENNYNENLNVTSGDLSETVSLSGTVNPAPVLYAYNPATSIISGKRYIIINSVLSTTTVAMGGQNQNNRGEIEIDSYFNSDDQNYVIPSDAGIYEFVINGPEIITKGEGEQQEQVEVYTIYDVNNSGYLYAASGGNYLRNRSFNEDDNGKWTIQIDDGEATIKAQGTNSRNWMRYNSQSNCFSCYSSGQDGIYLYVKDDTNYEFYKDIDNWTTAGEAVGGWYFIASPIDGFLTPDAVGNMLTADNGEEHTYDLYRLNHPTWENYRNEAHSGFTIANGDGYLYANAAKTTLKFSGASVKTYTTSNNTVTLTKDGWNLIGNPFTFPVAVDMAFGEVNNGSSITNKDANSVINPYQGIAVYGSQGNVVTFTKPVENAPRPSNLNLVLSQQATNRGTASTLDNAIVSFNEDSQLEKFYFGTQNANLYIPQGSEEYAIVNAEAQGEMPVNFRANEDGQYTLTVNPENVEMNYLHLIDNMTGNDVDLLAEPSYTFAAKTTDYESRFRLVFSASNVGNTEGNDNFAFFANGQLIINNEGEATLQVIDILGRQILTKELSTLNAQLSTLNFTAGVYVLRLINGNDVKVQKVVVR